MTNQNKYKSMTFRLRKNDKREAAIIRVLDDLNLNIHKSINQFIIDAIEYYIAHFDDHELIGPTSDAGKRRYVTRVEMNEALEKITDEVQTTKEEIKNQLFEEMLKLFVGGMNISNRSVIIHSEDSNMTQPNEGVTEQEVEEDKSLIDDVMKWS